MLESHELPPSRSLALPIAFAALGLGAVLLTRPPVRPVRPPAPWQQACAGRMEWVRDQIPDCSYSVEVDTGGVRLRSIADHPQFAAEIWRAEAGRPNIYDWQQEGSWLVRRVAPYELRVGVSAVDIARAKRFADRAQGALDQCLAEAVR